MDPEKRKILEDYLSNEDNIIHIQKITDNLNAIADKKPLLHPELVENDQKKIKLNHIIQPYNNLPPGSCGGHSYEIDSLYLEIKRACAFENDGEHQDKNLDKIREILNQKPNLINERATNFMITLLSVSVSAGAVLVTKELLKYNPNLFMINTFGETALNQGMKIARTHKSPGVFYSCVEILKAHQKAGTRDGAVFKNIITPDQNCEQLMADIIRIPLNSITS